MRYDARMGFTTIATAAAAVLPKIMEADALHRQSKQLNQAAAEQERLAARQADTLTTTAVANQQRGSRNAGEQVAQARTDAAASNLADTGSTRLREVDLATRLQDEITNNANVTLQQANATREQGAYTAWNTRNSAARARNQARASLFSIGGAIAGALAKD